MAHIHLQKVHKKVDLSDTPNYDGTCYDYSLTVTYYPLIYFKGSTIKFEEWLKEHFYSSRVVGIWHIPEDHEATPWEIAKDYFNEVGAEKLEEAMQDAVAKGIADCKEDVAEFIEEALESENADGTVFIEVW